MKCVFLLFILFSPFSAQANEAERLLTVAENYFLKEDYQSAFEIYQQLQASNNSKQINHAALYYNLGLSSYKLNDFALSYFYFIKSINLRPFDSETIHNLELAKKKLEGGGNVSYVPNFFGWHIKAFSYTPANIVLIIFLTLSFVSIALLLRKKSSQPATAFIITLAVIFVGISLGLQVNKFLRQGMVMSEKLVIRTGPSESFPELVTISAGSVIKVEQEKNTWGKVHFLLRNNKKVSGWTNLAQIEFL